MVEWTDASRIYSINMMMQLTKQRLVSCPLLGATKVTKQRLDTVLI